MTYVRLATRRTPAPTKPKPAAGIKKPHYYRIELGFVLDRVKKNPLEKSLPTLSIEDRDQQGWEQYEVNPFLEASGFRLINDWYSTTHESSTLVETKARAIKAQHVQSGNLYEIIYFDE